MTIGISQFPLNSLADVVRVFGDGLTSVVRFTSGSLSLPSQTALKNLTIVVENSDRTIFLQTCY